MKKLLPALFLFSLSSAPAQEHTSVQLRPFPRAGYRLLTGLSWPGPTAVQSKNYYLLTLFQSVPAVTTLLSTDTTLVRLTNARMVTLRTAGADCSTNSLCYIDRLRFSDAYIQAVSDRLGKLYTADNALGKLVAEHLLPSGTYQTLSGNSPKDLLVKAWQQDAAGINFAIGVYAAGQKPNYPAIDSISFSVSNKNYYQLVNAATTTIYEESKGTKLFFEPSLTAALRFLEMNEREQAADYEPMAETVNKAAVDRVKTLRWNDFAYTLILVPGAGPDEPAVPLSAMGMLRCRVAALRFREGTAPFLVVSGGNVHPYKTRYNEAMEMKRFMVETLHVPENAVIVDPHARHTTTNLRNTVRLMYRYGMPFDKPALTSTSTGQSQYITNGTLEARCRKELGYVPYRNGKRLSETEAEFYPLIDALQINPLEPLDP